MSVFFGMQIVRVDVSQGPAGIERDGFIVTDRHTDWVDAEKTMVRIARTIPGYLRHGEASVVSKLIYGPRINETGQAYIEYIGDGGVKVAELVPHDKANAEQTLDMDLRSP